MRAVGCTGNGSYLNHLEIIMSVTGNKNQNFLPDENENDEPEQELEQEPKEGGGHVPSTNTEPRIKNN
jgi:hypothetical protein